MRYYLCSFICMISPIFAGEILKNTQSNQLLRSDQTFITYYLQTGKLPAKYLAVILQGSDCNSIYNNQFVLENFANLTTNTDLLLVEKYGITKALPYLNDEERVDCPIDYLENDSVLQRVEDYTAVLNQVKDSYEAIYLIGGSEGAMIAALLSEKLDYLQAAVLLNGGGQFFIDDIFYFIETNVLEGHRSEAKSQFKESLAKLLNDENTPYLSGHGTKWWREIVGVDLQKSLENSHNRLLYIQTLNDQNVNWKGAVEMSKKVISEQVEFLFIEGQNHFFEDNEGQRFIGGMKEIIKQWLEQNI